MIHLRAIAAGLTLLPALVLAEPAVLSKDDNMRQKPFIDSKVVMPLKKSQKVDIQTRQGSWYFIKVQNKTGWAPMLSVRRSSTATPTQGNITKVTTGRSATGGVVSTTGVRGLNEDSLKTASFSEDAVVQAEKFRVTIADTGEFASSGGLVSQVVPPLATQKEVGRKQ